VDDLNGPPQIEKLLPPPPDEVAKTAFGVVGDIIEMPIRAVQQIAGSAQSAVNQIKQLPGK